MKTSVVKYSKVPNKRPPPPAYYFSVFFPTSPRPYPPFINFGAQGILLTIKILKIKFHRAHSSVFFFVLCLFCVSDAAIMSSQTVL